MGKEVNKMKKKILKISGLIIAMILVVCFCFQYVQTNARENKSKPWAQEYIDKKIEQEIGLSPTNEAVEQCDDIQIETKEYQIRNEEEKEKVKAYMKEAVENGGACSVEDDGNVDEIK